MQDMCSQSKNSQKMSPFLLLSFCFAVFVSGQQVVSTVYADADCTDQRSSTNLFSFPTNSGINGFQFGCAYEYPSYSDDYRGAKAVAFVVSITNSSAIVMNLMTNSMNCPSLNDWPNALSSVTVYHLGRCVETSAGFVRYTAPNPFNAYSFLPTSVTKFETNFWMRTQIYNDPECTFWKALEYSIYAPYADISSCNGAVKVKSSAGKCANYLSKTSWAAYDCVVQLDFVNGYFVNN